MDIFTVQPILLTEKADRLASIGKMHMFDIDVEGGQYYSESSVITAGDEVCVVETEFGPIE